MPSFKDNLGRSWDVSIDYATILRVRKAADVDLTKIFDPEYSAKLSDLEFLGATIDALLRPQFEKTGISFDQFATALDGQVLADAVDAIQLGVADFFPKARREIIHKMLSKTGELQKAQLESAMATLERIDPTSIASSGDSPASSESTPAHSPSGN
jgi:hypothetical protein